MYKIVFLLSQKKQMRHKTRGRKRFEKYLLNKLPTFAPDIIIHELKI